MRELAFYEISSISAGEKAISDMTVTEFLPYVTSVGAAYGAWYGIGSCATLTGLAFIGPATPYIGAALALPAAWVGSKAIVEQLSPYL